MSDDTAPESSDDAVTEEVGDDSEPGAELLHGVPVLRNGGQTTLHPGRDGYTELVERLRTEGYWVCTDLCGVDYLTYDAPRNLPVGVDPQRFEVVVELVNPTDRSRLRVRVQVPGEEPSLDSLVQVHPGMEAYERETWDLFGIVFEGHPHLSRILLPDDWEGHPLRKDSSVGNIPVQFKASRELRS